MTMAEQMARDIAKRWAKKAGSRHQYSEDSQSPGWCRCGLRKDEIDHEPAPAATVPCLTCRGGGILFREFGVRQSAYDCTACGGSGKKPAPAPPEPALKFGEKPKRRP